MRWLGSWRDAKRIWAEEEARAKRPPQASPPAAGTAPAPGPASSVGPPHLEMTERRSPRPPVVPAPGHDSIAYTLTVWNCGRLKIWQGDNMRLFTERRCGCTNHVDWDAELREGTP